MPNSEMEFVGVVLGGDMNSYAVARGFYEAYGIKTIVLGQFPIHPTKDSKIIEGHYYENLFDSAVLIKALGDIEALYPNTKKLMFGATDQYVKHIIVNRAAIENISDNYIIPIVDIELYDQLYEKKSFYALCEKHGLRYPKSEMFNFGKQAAELEDCHAEKQAAELEAYSDGEQAAELEAYSDGEQATELEAYHVPFDYPFFFKPSISAEYAEYEFEGKQKGYKIDSFEEFKTVVGNVAASGFKGDFIMQEYIEGSDDSMFVYTCYVNSEHRVQAITGGRILMEDRSPELIGNYNAISNARDLALCEQLKAFLEQIDFVGICHFDVQYVEKWQEYVVFEINIRQGRSNMYTLASGVNLPQLVVEDYVYGRRSSDCFVADREFTVSAVSERRLRKALEGTSAEKYISKNFYRFQLAPYDNGLKRRLRQEKADRLIMKDYMAFNR